jgi:hypothetical protein
MMMIEFGAQPKVRGIRLDLKASLQGGDAQDLGRRAKPPTMVSAYSHLDPRLNVAPGMRPVTPQPSP